MVVGSRFAVYMVGIIVILLGLYLLLTASGILEDIFGRSTAAGLALALIITLLGVGIMAASARLPRARRYYATRASNVGPGQPVYREGYPRTRVVKEGPPGEEREEYVED